MNEKEVRGVTKNLVKFYRGLKSGYNGGSTHKDAIYFATDTKELLMNNDAYGLGTDLKGLLDDSIKFVKFTEPDKIEFFKENNGESKEAAFTVQIPVASESANGLMSNQSVIDIKQLKIDVSNNNNSISSEITARKNVTGIQEDAYTPNQSTTYLKKATTLKDADEKLDAQIKLNTEAIESLTGGAGGSISDKITKAIQGLDKEDTAVNGQYVSQVSETDGVITVSRRNLVDPSDKILSFNADNGVTAKVNIKKLTSNELKSANLGENVKEAYKLVDKDGNKLAESDYVVVYKDSALKSVTFEGSEGAKQELVFTYINASGAEEVVRLDVSKLLVQSEFKNGLEVAESGQVSVKKDAASEDFLSVSADGVKVSGVQAAIDKADKLDQEIKVTGVNVGNLTNGKVLTANTSIEAILREMLMKEIDVTATEPTVSITNTGTADGTYEVGTQITPNLAHSYTDGKFVGATSDYSYTLNAGCVETATTYYRGSVALTGNTDTQTLSNSAISYKCTTAYKASTATPVTNLGKQSKENIPAGSVTSGTITFTGRYKYFMGDLDGDNAADGTLSSDQVRALTKKSDWVTDGTQTVVGSSAIKSNGGSIILAVPESKKLLTVQNGLGANIMGNFSVKKTVTVNCAGSAKKVYNLFIYPITNGEQVEFKNMTFGD